MNQTNPTASAPSQRGDSRHGAAADLSHAANRNSRAMAAVIIGEWLRDGIFPDSLMQPVTENRAFVMEVVYGVARWKRTLEWVIRRYTKRTPEDNVMPYLFTGIYQVLLMDNVADYAAVSETVEAAKREGRTTAGFVNAILRRVLRDMDSIRRDLKKQAPGLSESHPDMLIKRWTTQFGAEKALALCRWNNTRPMVTVYPHCEEQGLALFVASLGKAGITLTPHPFDPNRFFSLPPGIRVTDVPGFDEGLFNVQDPSTVKAIDLLDPKPGEFVLDACAAPGGKTSLISERMQDRGELVAMDLQEDRLDSLRENVGRMRMGAVRVAQGDATSEADVGALRGNRQFDRILLDVPCTNTGVLRRRPDARWRFSPEQLSQVNRIQRALLDNAARFLKPGGTMVYSTCSLEPEEDEGMVHGWVALHPRFKLIREVKLFPPETLTDGIYAASVQLSHDSQNYHQ